MIKEEIPLDQLIVKDSIVIDASPEKVWEVLTHPKFVAQWDELPEDYPDEPMTIGSKVIWEHPNGGETVTEIIKVEERKELVIALYSSQWKVMPHVGDVAYRYQLEDLNGKTLLKIEIGDFSLLENGQDYYDASVEFAMESKEMTKKLAEKL